MLSLCKALFEPSPCHTRLWRAASIPFEQARLSCLQPSRHTVLLPTAWYSFHLHGFLLMDKCSCKECYIPFTVFREICFSPTGSLHKTLYSNYLDDIQPMPSFLENITHTCKTYSCKNMPSDSHKMLSCLLIGGLEHFLCSIYWE